MVIFMIMMSAGVGALIGALRTAGINKQATAARQLAQGDFEKLKALVFQAASGATLLSTYYPNLTASTGRGTNGYVDAATARYVADGDPASGAFYRTVVNTLPTSTVYSRYVTLQFLDTSTSPVTVVTPPASYYPTSVPLPSQIVRATETVVWTAFGRRTYNITSEITTGRASAVRSSGQARMVSVRLSGTTAAGDKVALEGPSITVDATLTDNAVAAVSARGAEASLSLGGRAVGASGTANAPADETATATSAVAGSLASGSTTAATYGPSTTSGLVAKASYATPLVSTSAVPATASLSANGAGPALTMTTLDAVTSAPAKLQLASANVAVASVPCSGCASFGATGWLSTADSGSAHAVDATVGSSNPAEIGLFPTSFAPLGVVRLRLTSSSLTCHAGGTYPSTSAPTATPSYAGTVFYWSATGSGGSPGYVTVNVSPTTTGLTAGMLSTKVTTYAGADVLLSDYITSWNSATSSSLAAKTQSSADNKSVSTNLDGFINVTTAGVLAANPSSSAISVQLGIATCASTDAR